MRTKDQFIKLVKDARVMLASDAEANCSCPSTNSEWHGDCYSCIRIHRHFGDHVPSCLQSILQDKVKELARAAEMTVEPKLRTPAEYGEYVKKVAPVDPRKPD